jgi:hypothetical protein
MSASPCADQLAQDNQRLRHQLAQALGQIRAAGIRPDR